MLNLFRSLSVATLFLFLVGAQNSVKAQSLQDLDGVAYLVGAEGVFLGVVSSNRRQPDSICNPYGDFGNRYSDQSIWNRYGNFGSRYSDFSAFNARAEYPPVMVIGDEILAYVSVGGYENSIDPRVLWRAFCS